MARIFANITAEIDEKMTQLKDAIEYNKISEIKELIDGGMDINFGWYDLHLFKVYRDVKESTIDFLISNGFDMFKENTYLFDKYHRHSSFYEDALGRMMYPNIVDKAISNGHKLTTEQIKTLRVYFIANGHFSFADDKTRFEYIKMLKKHGVEWEMRMYTWMITVVSSKIMKMYLPSVILKDRINEVDENGFTMLSIIVLKGKKTVIKNMVEMLLSLGADANVKAEGKSLVEVATRRNLPEIEEMLKQAIGTR